jgi:hypothetical protein
MRLLHWKCDSPIHWFAFETTSELTFIGHKTMNLTIKLAGSNSMYTDIWSSIVEENVMFLYVETFLV